MLTSGAVPSGRHVHLAHLVPRMNVHGGTQRYVRDLAMAQAAAGATVRIYSGAFLPEHHAALTEGGVFTHTVAGLGRALSPRRDLLAGVALTQLLRAHRPDVLHAHSAKGGVLGPLAARICGVSARYTVHGWAALRVGEGGPLRRATLRLAARAGLRACDEVIVLCESDYAYALQEGLATAAQLRLLPTGLARPPRPADPPPPGPPHIISTTRFDWPKRPDQLLMALRRLHLAEPDLPWRVTIAGEGPGLVAARAQVERLGLGERVALPGHVRDVAALLATGHIFVLTSDWEGVPLSLLEGMAAGLACAASAVGGIPETLGAAGVLLPTNTTAVDTLYDTLLRWLTDDAARSAAASAARQAWQARGPSQFAAYLTAS